MRNEQAAHLDQALIRDSHFLEPAKDLPDADLRLALGLLVVCHSRTERLAVAGRLLQRRSFDAIAEQLHSAPGTVRDALESVQTRYAMLQQIAARAKLVKDGDKGR